MGSGPAARLASILTSTSRIAGVELRRRLRNRSAVYTAVLGPLALALVFGILLGGTSSLSLRIGVVDADGSELTSGFTAALTGDDGDDEAVQFVPAASEADARARVDDGDLDAAIVLPAGFAHAVTTGGPASITILRDPRGEISAGIAESVAAQYASSVSSRALAVATVAVLGGPTPTDDDLAALRSSVLTAVRDEAAGGREVDVASFFGFSMSILFLFFTISFAARGLIAERAAGLVPRMLAASTPPAAIVVGKVLAVCVLGLGSFLTVWAVTALGFGSDWGDPLAVVAAIVATVAAVGGVAVFVCGLARTEQQADGYTSMVAFALALLGGNFVGPGQAPDALQRLAAFTPNGQALDAFSRIAVDETGVGGIVRQLLVLVGFAAVFGALGLALIGRTVRR